MNHVMFRPLPLPLERVRPSVGLLVLAFHLGLLWVATIHWPIQSALLGAVQNTAQIITLQLAPKSPAPSKPVDRGNLAFSNNPQAITNPTSQRFGRAEATLQLPAPPVPNSTPLASTQQLAQPALKTVPVPVSVPVSVPLAATVTATVPIAATASATVPTAATAAAFVTTPTSAASSSAAVVEPGAAPADGVSQATSTVASSPSPGATTSGVPSAGQGAPANLNATPRYAYRPPIAIPRRSVSDMANDQLRRRPRDAFAQDIEGASNKDCFKDAPEGSAQGLLAIGPLLMRAMQEKCRK